MTTHWLVDQGDFAIQASLMVGGYLAAAVLLSYLPTRTRLHHAARFAAALLIVLAALLPALSSIALIIGIITVVALWAAATWLSGPRMAVVHFLFLGSSSFLIGSQSVTNNWIEYAITNPAESARIGVYLAAYALVTAPASYTIAWLLKRTGLRSEASRPEHNEGAIHESSAVHGQEEASQSNLAGSTRDTSPTRGRAIGILERLILLTLALLGQWGAAGLVIAAKSIARFRNLEDRDFAEYYLVGTLASLLAAVMIAAAALAIS